jgi:molecular chaperone GrpE
MFRILEKEGLKAIESVGKPFDKDLHEAITSVPAGEDKTGIVIDEAEKGYRLKDKVIRYAKVIVGE